jgi:hypothetical protein
MISEQPVEWELETGTTIVGESILQSCFILRKFLVNLPRIEPASPMSTRSWNSLLAKVRM